MWLGYSMGVKTQKQAIFSGFLKQTLDIGLFVESTNQIDVSSISENIHSKMPKLNIDFEKILLDFLVKVLKEIPLPRRFSPKKMAKQWILESKAHLEELKRNLEISQKSKNTKKYDELKELFYIANLLFTKSKHLYGNDDLIEVAPFIDRINTLIQKYITKAIQSTEETKNQYSKIFLMSNFPSRFVSITTKAQSALQTYLTFLQKEFVDLCNKLSEYFWDNRKINSIKIFDSLFLEYQPEFIKKILELIFDLLKLQIFIVAWNARNFNDFFSLNIENYRIEKLKRRFFQKILKNIELLSNEILQLVLDIAYVEEKIIQQTNDKDYELNELAAKLIHTQYM